MFITKQEVNTGRQKEFDYLKGLFVPMIILIHAFQLMGGTGERFYELFYPVCTLTGSTIFLFVMGLGSTYSKRTPKEMAFTGVKLILWQVAWNVFALALPFLIGQGGRALFGLSMDMWPVALQQIVVLLQYINIFFIAGVVYLIFALFKKLQLPTWAYLVIAVVLLIVSPFLYISDFRTGIGVIDYVLTMFCGGRDSVSLIFWPNFVYALFGVCFGRLLHHTSSKKRLYACILPVALLVGGVYVMYVVLRSESYSDICYLMSYDYVFSGTFRMLANLSCTLFGAGVLYALRRLIQKITPLDRLLLHFNKRTSAYYAIHPFLYSLIASVMVLAPMDWIPCVIIAVINTVIVWLVIRLWDRIYKPKKK